MWRGTPQCKFVPTAAASRERKITIACIVVTGWGHRQQADRASGMPTNAGLTSLASLVSAVSAQRTLPPASKDGLSALSYARRPDRTALVAEPGSSEVPDDEPMPIP